MGLRETGVALLGGILALGLTASPGAAASASPGTTAHSTPVISAITIGFSHTCALTAAGRVLCWGRNEYGALGNGSWANSSVPVEVSGVSGVVAITAGAHHTCALTRAGAVWCWGYNAYHQLGNGTTDNSPVPLAIGGLGSRVTAISAGIQDTCALLATGTVRCWGDNPHGQLGDGTTTTRTTPVDVTGLPAGVRAISTGGYHTCALTTGGDVWCWGGLLGSGTPKDTSVPVEVSGLPGSAAAISAGMVDTCALMSGGDVECWGDNAYRELGPAASTSGRGPVVISGLPAAIRAVAAGGAHTCVVTAAGTVMCWGFDFHGELGNGTFTPVSASPVKVTGISGGVDAIAAGGHSCAVMTGGTVKCWGFNYHGQLGNGTTTDSSVPVAVVFPVEKPAPTAAPRLPAPSSFTAIAVGGYHACALSSDGRVFCWGQNLDGQLGDGTRTERHRPIEVTGLPGGVTAITAGLSHTCALTSAGEVWCWGSNSYRQLGDGATASSSVPVRVPGLVGSGVRAIAAGATLTCAITATRAAVCWGLGGRLGDGTTRDSGVPVQVVGLASGVQAIVAAGLHACALTGTFGVVCWGLSSQGQLGNGSTTGSWVPVEVSGLQGVAAGIFTGYWHTCAATTDDALKCWGVDGNGEFGDGRRTNSSVPVDVPGPASGLHAFAAGGSQTCGLAADGTAWCWGANWLGQLGNGTTTPSSVPVQVLGLPDGNVSISAGLGDTCVLTRDGGVACWGDNGHGQVGDGTTTMRLAPATVSFTGLGTPTTSTAAPDEPANLPHAPFMPLLPLLAGLLAAVAILVRGPSHDGANGRR